MSYNIVNAIVDFFTGKLELVSPQVNNERALLCDTCEVRNKTLNTCTICGCFLPAKRRLKKSTCPMELW